MRSLYVFCALLLLLSSCVSTKNVKREKEKSKTQTNTDSVRVVKTDSLVHSIKDSTSESGVILTFDDTTKEFTAEVVKTDSGYKIKSKVTPKSITVREKRQVKQEVKTEVLKKDSIAKKSTTKQTVEKLSKEVRKTNIKFVSYSLILLLLFIYSAIAYIKRDPFWLLTIIKRAAKQKST